MTPRIVLAEEQHIEFVAGNLRPEDRAEVEAMGLEPIQALEQSLRGSLLAWTILSENGKPIAMFGLGKENMISPEGQPWMLGTPDLLKNRMWFLRRTKGYLWLMGKFCDTLVQYVDARYAVCLRWLNWAGFSISDPEPIGKDGALFCRVELRKE